MDNKDLEKYLIEIGKAPLLSVEEEIELAKVIQQKGVNCDEMKKLVKCNERFVLSVARQYQNRGLSIEELIKAGRAGLEKAALKFDASRGFKFIAYAVWWIRREILIAIESPDVDVINPIHDPAILQELCNNGSKSAALKLGQMYDKGDKTLVDELAQKYGEPENELGLYISMNILMKTLVGSHYYDGNLLTMNTDDPECIVLHAEANRVEPLLYALRQAFPNLDVEVKETKLS